MHLLMILIAGSLLAVTAQTPAVQTPNPAASAPAGNAQTGKRLYDNHGCYECHGYVGQGGAGPRIAPRPLAFQAFSRYLRLPSGQMPPYTVKVLSDQQIADIYAYLRSLPEPPSVDSIPILRNQ